MRARKPILLHFWTNWNELGTRTKVGQSKLLCTWLRVSWPESGVQPPERADRAYWGPVGVPQLRASCSWAWLASLPDAHLLRWHYLRKNVCMYMKRGGSGREKKRANGSNSSSSSFCRGNTMRRRRRRRGREANKAAAARRTVLNGGGGCHGWEDEVDGRKKNLVKIFHFHFLQLVNYCKPLTSWHRTNPNFFIFYFLFSWWFFYLLFLAKETCISIPLLSTE